MNYKIVIEKAANKFIQSQDPKQRQRLLKAIYNLPNGTDIEKIKGADEKYRLRVGDYRILYTKQKDKLIITVIKVDNRGSVYKN